ncbi:(Fe-S)-binding protein [uncultured Nevskia sp.]|uniref:(Fe-S)-binding protein n=1 Tax=uncultured Nevskia sp. TaxID=228950 RepID=UPI0025CC470C|nr:(Fe-S)-binding protein [uncultured Nevskia sp.]
MPPPESHPFPLAAADLCVKCGLCLPHCPTYQQAGHEADSPRGRIMLMQGLATGRIVPSSSLERHLDGCLGCRACERVCPASVPYGELIDAGRAQLAATRPERLRLTRVLSGVLSRRSSRRLLATLLWLYAASGVQGFLRRFHLLGHGQLARLESTMPRIERLRAPRAPTVARPRGKVGVFVGCIGDIAERAVADDLAQLLADCGYATDFVAAQTCCGAIDQHAGRPATAAQLAVRNITAFGKCDEPILPLATGCAATLLDYPRLAADGGKAFAKRLRDPVAFLLEHGEPLRFKPTPLKVAIHEPCTQRNVIRRGDALRSLLARIPELEIVELDATSACCGAAGSHFISHPEQADALLAPKLAAAERLQPDVIVSSNIGCSLHLAAGLRRAGAEGQSGATSPELLHPLRLLARCRA